MNIVIVDDEIEIREGLRRLIEKLDNAGHYRIAAVCDGAVEALDALSRENVDVLMTDIRMSQMDGLLLTETAKKLYPALQVIMLSGYSQFDYARQALKLEASDYLLKPVRKEDLEGALAKLYDRHVELRESRIYLDQEEFRQRLSGYAAIIAADEDGTTGSELQTTELTLAMKDIVAGLPNAYLLKGFITKNGSGAVVGLYGGSAAEVEKLIGGICSAVREYGERMESPVSIGVSDILQDQRDAHTLYLHACTALASRIIGGGGVWFYKPASFNGNLFRIDLSRIDVSLDILDFTALGKEIQQLMEVAADSGEIGFLIWTINTIILSLNEKVKSFNHLNEAAPYDISAFLFKILWCRSRGELASYMQERVKALLCHLSPEKREGHIIQKAKQYIRLHLDEPLTLADIGQEVCVSVSYLSRLFREKTGGTFLEYLTGERMNQAKELLSDPGVKVYEAAEKVGYGSWKHFSRTFKEVTGHTPAEYRQNLYSRSEP
ncbi:response regulator transcription factor [Paenibacillus nasutitermitis]|uniref:Stage 0 sporulation protein A homolog n=1 Tax=Paenibacillus nasutitermitis TaxID=1652958 RepID=A0A917DLE7_9BACL|nr:response regulator [Paenibacillus nasutitermitis]GGD48517.1 hypothetical protein GCM10010911_02550 [Paenibacillus nasutitermitis]